MSTNGTGAIRERNKPGFASRLEQAACAVLYQIERFHDNCPLCQRDRGTGHRRGCPIAQLEKLTA